MAKKKQPKQPKKKVMKTPEVIDVREATKKHPVPPWLVK